MKYADEQIVRPQHENGCDYGHGRRSVLVRNGKQELLHIAGQKHWSGIGLGRNYSATEIALYPDERGACKQYSLAEGRMTRRKWEHIAEKIYAHLGVRFPTQMISLKHTLLLDEPGEIDGPPPRVEGPKKVHLRIESDRFCRVYEDPDVPGKCRYIETAIVKQWGGKLSYRLSSGRVVEKPVKQAMEEGGGTREEAEAVYLRYYEMRVAEAAERLQRAAHSFTYNDDNLTEAKNRIEALRKETP